MIPATLYHGDPEDCPYTEAEHRFVPSTGLCAGHDIPAPPSPCACVNDAAGPCPFTATDPEEAPYCTDCYSARVYGTAGRDCTHEEP